MRHDCDICRGAGKVRLPVFHRAELSFEPEAKPALTEAAREYPCPECADVVRLERVQAAREETVATSAYIKDAGFIDHVKDCLAHQLAGYLLRSGFIRFERSPEDATNMSFSMRATLGVVRPKQLDNLEERIAERQTEVAQEVVAEAERGINNWGSYYRQENISKDQATREVREAIQAVLKKRAAWTKV